MQANLRIVLFAALAAIALVSFVIVRTQQGAGAETIARQQQAQALTPAKVASLVRQAPEAASGPKGLSASCVPLGTGELHNPWRCTITYPHRTADQYSVTINTDGTYTGSDQIVYSHRRSARSDGEISGCCVPVP
ncbi:MAG TPA: hypothetical protein VGH56_05340 [Solirubrobacteraceae bacterium]|jgi:hypothetical protein